MKRKRIFIFFVCFIVVFVLIFFSSSFFVLKNIELCLFEQDEYANYLKVNNTVNSCNFQSVYKDVGTSIFKINKEKYIKPFELDNPIYKILSVRFKFPNSVVFNVAKRKETFYISNGIISFVLDENFKILTEISTSMVNENLIYINAVNNNTEETYFSFFEIEPTCYYPGYFLEENNLLMKDIKDMCEILNKVNLTTSYFKKLSFTSNEETANLICYTTNDYGIKIVIENIEENFNAKFLKVLNAFLTLEKTERIKTTYGSLIINNSLNCLFLNN